MRIDIESYICDCGCGTERIGKLAIEAENPLDSGRIQAVLNALKNSMRAHGVPIIEHPPVRVAAPNNTIFQWPEVINANNH